MSQPFPDFFSLGEKSAKISPISRVIKAKVKSPPAVLTVQSLTMLDKFFIKSLYKK